jgi:hypothetical protein
MVDRNALIVCRIAREKETCVEHLSLPTYEYDTSCYRTNVFSQESLFKLRLSRD